MKNKINNILVGLLWLLAITMGADFWFNTKYGFNMFSFQHWQYLAYMQASNQPVKTSFYISILLYIALLVFGLYVLIQPRRRKIVLPVFDRTQPTMQTPVSQPQTSTVEQTPTEQTKTEQPETPQQQATTYAGPALTRPPRLNTPTITRAPVPTGPLSAPAQNTKTNPEQDYADIHDVFTSNGYLVKGAPRIKGIQTSVIAIGTDEVLWIGASGVSTTDMTKAVDTLKGVFTDTLEDIEIDVHAFIIDATDKNADNDILLFDTVEDLRTYIDAHQNIAPDEDEAENFDAYSAYIGTVIDYIRKI
ncbi:MAG: hypothetical protein J5679_01375 [Alphaproteobacteria bacterium]|nr:hypothetical protein [Alphaproteobacteria bacterium]